MYSHTHSGVNTVFIIFGYVTLPILLLICYYIFIVLSYSATEVISSNRNVIMIACACWLYIGIAILIFTFGQRMGRWASLMSEKCGLFIIIVNIVLFPLYYLFTLPMTTFYVFRYLGSPAKRWQKIFGNTCMTMDNFQASYIGSHCKMVLFYFTVGPLYGLFTLLYCVLLFALFPIYFVICSPFGFGPYGLNLYHSLRHLSDFGIYSWDCIEITYLWCIIIVAWFWALPAMFFALIYMGFVSAVAWWAILLLIVAAIYFFAFGIVSTTQICCNRFISQVV